MTSHELAEHLLRGPNLPVHCAPNGYDDDYSPEVRCVGTAVLSEQWRKVPEPKLVVLLCNSPYSEYGCQITNKENVIA